jgi:hypothetical protein
MNEALDTVRVMIFQDRVFGGAACLAASRRARRFSATDARELKSAEPTMR